MHNVMFGFVILVYILFITSGPFKGKMYVGLLFWVAVGEVSGHEWVLPWISGVLSPRAAEHSWRRIVRIGANKFMETESVQESDRVAIHEFHLDTLVKTTLTALAVWTY